MNPKDILRVGYIKKFKYDNTLVHAEREERKQLTFGTPRCQESTGDIQRPETSLICDILIVVQCFHIT